MKELAANPEGDDQECIAENGAIGEDIKHSLREVLFEPIMNINHGTLNFYRQIVSNEKNGHIFLPLLSLIEQVFGLLRDSTEDWSALAANLDKLSSDESRQMVNKLHEDLGKLDLEEIAALLESYVSSTKEKAKILQ